MKIPLCFVAVFSLSYASSFAGAPRFLPLGYGDNYATPSEALAVIGDGTKIVGYSTSNVTGNLATLWTSGDRWQTNTPNFLPGNQNWHSNTARAISADGGIIVGVTGFGSNYQGFYYTPPNNFQFVPFSTALFASDALGVSGDGSIVVGGAQAQNGGVTRAYRWDRTQANATFIPSYNNATALSAVACAISDDGTRVVGFVQLNATTYAAARWENGAAPVLLQQTGDAAIPVQGLGITPDGAVVVGNGLLASNPNYGVGFRWTRAGGTVPLLPPTHDVYNQSYRGATAEKISGNGRVIVGYALDSRTDDDAIVWIDLQPYRVADLAFAVLPSQWAPFRASGADYFGNVVCGKGQDTAGSIQAYAFMLDSTFTAPLAAPIPRVAFNATTHNLTMRYQSVPGLKYRMFGGTNVASLPPLTSYNAGLGDERGYSVTNNASKYFLRVEVAPN